MALRPPRREVVLAVCLLALGGISVRLRAAPTEEIRVQSLGERGVTFRSEDPWEIRGDFSRVGDMNGDGLADFLLLRVSSDAREVLLVYGWGDEGFPAEPSMEAVLGRSTVLKRTLSRSGVTDHIERLDSTGDVDGDGFDDIWILRTYGIPPDHVDGGIPDVVHLVFGAPDLPAAISLDEPPPGVRMTLFTSSKANNTSLCLDVEAGGDVNADGVGDLVFAAGFSETDGTTRYPPGRVYVLFGGDPLEGTVDVEEIGRSRPEFTLDGEIDGGGLGRTADFDGGGDFNGDGLDDLVVVGDRIQGAITSSYVLFGSNGDARFVRGDVDLDDKLVITDPIALLGGLFLGEAPPSCRDAADANDDGGLDIADAVWILGYLYTGGAPPPSPFPKPGRDPTPDDLDCRPDRGG